MVSKIYFTSFIKKDMKTNNISFGAKFISAPTIQKYDKNLKSFQNKKVSFVQFEPENRSDKLAIKMANNKWGRYFITQSIYLCADMLSRKECSKEVNKIFILTEQTDNFKKLLASKILALAQTKEEKGKTVELMWLQTRPQIKYNNTENREIKHAGKAIIDSLKELTNELVLGSTTNSKNFYSKQGFELIDKINLKYHWKK